MDALNQIYKSKNDTSIDSAQQQLRLICGKGTTKDQWMNWQGLKKLPAIDIDHIFPKQSRVVILSPHPDDEILGCGGLIQQLHAIGREILVLGVTNGTGSHPHSSKYTIEQLDLLRPMESQQALKILARGKHIDYFSLNLTDGKITLQKDQLDKYLRKLIKHTDILITTFEKDGHPDHESLGHYVRLFAEKNQIQNLQMMIWAWHWAQPNDPQIDWTTALRLDLSESQITQKAKAIQCFKTQTENDETTGSDPIVPEYVIDRILMPWELYFHAK